jgi:outer membrane immunogenic protein
MKYPASEKAEIIQLVEQSHLPAIRGRIGYAFAPAWLVYVTGGGAATSAKLTIADAAIGVAPLSQSDTRWGWTVGAGVEWGFSGNWSLKLEYLHADFGNSNYFTPDINTGVIVVLSQNARLTDDMVRVGVNYRFNWAGPVVARY